MWMRNQGLNGLWSELSDIKIFNGPINTKADDILVKTTPLNEHRKNGLLLTELENQSRPKVFGGDFNSLYSDLGLSKGFR